jgi:uncharacterized protein
MHEVIMISVRPHHLLCILSESGKGYAPGFVQLFRDIRKRFLNGEPVVLTNGSDELCTTCPFDQDNGFCCSPTNERAPDDMDRRINQALHLNYGDQVVKDELFTRIKKLSVEEFIQVCDGCSWRDEMSCSQKILERIEKELSP